METPSQVLLLNEAHSDALSEDRIETVPFACIVVAVMCNFFPSSP